MSRSTGRLIAVVVILIGLWGINNALQQPQIRYVQVYHPEGPRWEQQGVTLRDLIFGGIGYGIGRHN